MTTTQLKLYIVSTQFSDGIGGLHFVLGFNQAEGVGQAMDRAMHTEPIPQGRLSSIMAQEVDISVVRATLAAMETGQTSDQRVVPLRAVGPAPEPVTQALSADTEHRSDVRPVDDPAA